MGEALAHAENGDDDEVESMMSHDRARTPEWLDVLPS